MMKNLFVFAAACLALCFTAGCTPRYAEVHGEYFEMISEREEAQLVEKTRLFVKTISGKIPRADMEHINKTEPDKRFIYSDHRYGRAIIKWDFPTYEVGVEYMGELMSKHMNSTVFTKKKHNKVLDFSRRPVRAPGSGRR